MHFNYSPALDAVCRQVDFHDDGMKKLAYKYGVFGGVELALLNRNGGTNALLSRKKGFAKHTVEELAYFLVELGMETTARDAMVKELCVIPADRDDLVALRDCGERLRRRQ
jgi:hypothetical protein